MAELPNPNSGGLDPQVGGLDPLAAKPRAPLWRRVRAWAIIVALYAMILGMAAAAVPLLRTAFSPGVSLDDRLMHLLWAGGVLLPLGFMARYFVRVRLKTGRWRGTSEQRLEERQQRVAQCSVRGGKRACGALQTPWPTYIVKWASCSAFAPACTRWQRAAAWLVLATYTLAVLAVAGFGVICFGAAFDHTNTLQQSLLFVGLGVVVLIWPVIVAVRLVRGIRAGRVGATREQLDEMRAQRSAWATRENQKPLRSKLMGTAVSLAVYALWWMRATLHHAQHPHESWTGPAVALPFILYSVWVQFRRPKSAPPATEN